jgi:oligopeptidase B
LHRIGTAADQDVLLYKDDNLSYYVGVSKSKSERFIWIDSASKITTEVSFVDLSKSVTKVELFTPRRENIKYDVDHHENRFIIQTNENAENFKLMTAPLDDFRLENWKTLVPYDVKHSIDGIDIYKNHIVIIERHKGLQNFRVLDCATGILNNIEFNEPLYAVGSDHNEVYDTTTLRLSYSSLKTPPQTRHYDLVTRKQTIVKSKTVPNFNPDDYEMERSFALSRDGKTQIPLSIIYKKGFKKTAMLHVFCMATVHTVFPQSEFLTHDFQFVGPGFCLCTRAHPWRRRLRPHMVQRRKIPQKRKYFFRLHRLCNTFDPRKIHGSQKDCDLWWKCRRTFDGCHHQYAT